LHSLLQQGSDPDSLRTFLEMVKLMEESAGGRLVERGVIALGTRSRRVLELVGDLVTLVKKHRLRLSSPQGPSGAARKVRSRKVRSSLDAHHHHDSFGCAFALIPTQQTCSVTKLSMVSFYYV